MIVGFLEILFAGFINVAILLIPFIGLEWLRVVVTRFLLRIEVRSDLFVELTQAISVGLGLLIAAAIQIALWRLVPRQDPANWRMAVVSYAAGMGAIMLFRLNRSTSQADRRRAVWSASLGTILFIVIFAMSFVSTTVYEGVRRVPDRVLRFVMGTT